jgi:cytoskeletal protein RodZ
MEEDLSQKTSGESQLNLRDEITGDRPLQKPPAGGKTETQKGLGWGVWVLLILVLFLLMSSIANLVVSHRANESSRNQAKAIEQLTQSIKEMQRSIADLSNLIEQSPQEEEEPEEDSGEVPTGDGSI